MKHNILIVGIALLFMTSYARHCNSEGRYGASDRDEENNIDWCHDHDDDQCYCNKINLQGSKIVLVNLDDHCQLDDIEDEGGIFILSGDMLIITGRENDGAFQSWDERTDFDTGVLSLDQGNDIDIPVQGSTVLF